jgi:hypothetical protein
VVTHQATTIASAQRTNKQAHKQTKQIEIQQTYEQTNKQTTYERTNKQSASQPTKPTNHPTKQAINQTN